MFILTPSVADFLKSERRKRGQILQISPRTFKRVFTSSNFLIAKIGVDTAENGPLKKANVRIHVG